MNRPLKMAAQQTPRSQQMESLDTAWHNNPEQFNPLRNALERERILRTLELIDKHLSTQGIKVADLGCGSGILAQKLREKGAEVDAVDASKTALEKCSPGIRTFQAVLPTTTLADDSYDLVIAADLIGYINPKGHRLLFNELSRLVKKEGFVACSTPLDINSDDALEHFAALAETELEIIAWSSSYHRFYIRVLDFLKAWKLPFQWLRQSRTLLLAFEKASYFIWEQRGISHTIFIAKRKPLFQPAPEKPPIELKQKRTVWE